MAFMRGETNIVDKLTLNSETVVVNTGGKKKQKTF